MIVHGHAHRYADFYYGSVYHDGHHHHHRVYRFPVYLEGSLVYRPYAYCGDKYFATGHFGIDGPRFSIRFNF